MWAVSCGTGRSTAERLSTKMGDVLSIFDHLSHLYGECTRCSEMEFAIIVDEDGGVRGFQCLYCKAVGMFDVTREIIFEMEE